MSVRDDRSGALLHRFANWFELPRDVVLDLPRATLVGDNQLVLENHKGVVEYTPALVRIRTSQGEMEVSGSQLRIGSLFREEMVIEGRIESVRFTRRWEGSK